MSRLRDFPNLHFVPDYVQGQCSYKTCSDTFEKLARISQLSNISLEVGESKREPFMIGIRVKNRHIMIEIFETCQTKSIAKQTNRDESLIIRSITVPQN